MTSVSDVPQLGPGLRRGGAVCLEASAHSCSPAKAGVQGPRSSALLDFWAPAFAGELECLGKRVAGAGVAGNGRGVGTGVALEREWLWRGALTPKRHHPGEGRGPIGGRR